MRVRHFAKYLLVNLLPCNTMATSASRKVFSIAELAEQILGYLTLDDILVLDNVNQSLRSLIKTSPRLQQTLTISPDLSQTSELLSLPPFELWFCGSLVTLDGERLQLDYQAKWPDVADMPSRLQCALAKGRPIGSSWRRVRISPHVPVEVSVLAVCGIGSEAKMLSRRFAEGECTLEGVAELLEEMLATYPGS